MQSSQQRHLPAVAVSKFTHERRRVCLPMKNLIDDSPALPSLRRLGLNPMEGGGEL